MNQVRVGLAYMSAYCAGMFTYYCNQHHLEALSFIPALGGAVIFGLILPSRTVSA